MRLFYSLQRDLLELRDGLPVVEGVPDGDGALLHLGDGALVEAQPAAVQRHAPADVSVHFPENKNLLMEKDD